MLPENSGLTRERLSSVPGCLGVRQRPDGLHAIFQRNPDGCRQLLEAELGVAGVQCTVVGLEEMFIELAGGSR